MRLAERLYDPPIQLLSLGLFCRPRFHHRINPVPLASDRELSLPLKRMRRLTWGHRHSIVGQAVSRDSTHRLLTVAT
jgi:hypothetical protein